MMNLKTMETERLPSAVLMSDLIFHPDIWLCSKGS